MTKKRDAKGQLRDYKKEAAQHKKPKAAEDNRARKRARYLMEKKGKVRPGDGKEVDHKKPLAAGGSEGPGNLQVISRHKNRIKQPKRKKR